MDQLNDFVKSIECFKPFYFHCIEELFAKELAKSIVKMMIKLGISENDIMVYDSRLARLRGVVGTDGKPYYGVSYRICKSKKDGWDSLTVFELNGKYYEITDYWKEEIPWDENAINSSPIQICFCTTLERIYNYLRMEMNTSKLKRRFTIEKD